jgi:PAS domain S-box-containing protein
MTKLRTPNKQYIYYFLASCACISILFSIIYSHINSENLQAILAKKTRSVNLHTTLSKLSVAAGKLSSPGNDVFLSKDAKKELHSYQVAEERFHKIFLELEREVANDLSLNEIAENDLSEIKALHGAVNSYNSEIFSLFEKGDTKQAASIMAKMDRKFQLLSNQLNLLRSNIIQRDLIAIEQFKTDLDRRNKQLWWLSIVSMLLFFFLATYGFRLSSRIRKDFIATDFMLSKQEIISKELSTTNQYLEYILEGAHLGSWDWWLKDNTVKFDRRWLDMIGLEDSEGIHNLSTWESRVHPEDKAKAYEDIKTHLAGKTSVYENVHRMRHKNGSWVWILDRGKISERDEEGNPLRFTGTHFDITQYKEQELLSSEIQKIANIGAWELDLKTQKTRWSEQTYKIHDLPVGTPTDQIMGINFYAAHEQDRIKRYIADCIAGQNFRDTFEFIDAKGKKKWVESVGEPVKNAEGNIYKIRGTFQDVTEQKSASILLKSEEERFKRLVLNSPGMVYEFKMEADGKMYFPYASPKAMEIYEIEPEDFHKNPSIMVDLVAPDEKEDLTQKIQASAQNLTAFEWRGQIMTKAGKRKWISARSTPEKLHDGSILWHGIVIDISKEVETNLELEQEKVKALHASKLASLGEVSAGIAHEINNPLAVVAGTLPILKKYLSNPEKYEEKIDAMKRSCERISKIINGLRKFSRSHTYQELKKEQLAKIIEEVQILTQPKISEFDIQFIVAIEDQLELVCDELELEQVFVNLIHNACDAIKDNPLRWIKIEAKKDDLELVIRVMDSGAGIPKEIQDRIFQPFFTTKPVGKGTGLGLSISKGILNSHKADFFVNTKFPNTCFEMRFPIGGLISPIRA